MSEKVQRTDEEWRALLTAEQYAVLRQQGTEPPFSGAFWDSHADASYRCAGCGAELFDSGDKFDSGTGWPSFTRPVEQGRVALREDSSHGMRRVEVVCAACDGHLGHVFPDGPGPDRQRYCINSCSLEQSERGA